MLRTPSAVLCIYLPSLIDRIHPSLGQINQKHYNVSKARKTMHSGHLDNEREQVVDEGVDESGEGRREEGSERRSD